MRPRPLAVRAGVLHPHEHRARRLAGPRRAAVVAHVGDDHRAVAEAHLRAVVLADPHALARSRTPPRATPPPLARPGRSGPGRRWRRGWSGSASHGGALTSDEARDLERRRPREPPARAGGRGRRRSAPTSSRCRRSRAHAAGVARRARGGRLRAPRRHGRRSRRRSAAAPLGVLTAAREPLTPARAAPRSRGPSASSSARSASWSSSTCTRRSRPRPSSRRSAPTRRSPPTSLRAPHSPRVLCGDLNTPRREHADGSVLTFAHDSSGRLRPERGERWDAAERALVHTLRDEHGWVDAFRALHGYGTARRAGRSRRTAAAGGSTTCSSTASRRSPPPTRTSGAARA